MNILNTSMIKIFSFLFSILLCTQMLPYNDGGSRQVPIIMYHSVCNAPNNGYVILPSILENDLAFLKKKGYTAVWINDIIDFTEGRKTLPAKPIVLSFDDGFYNNYSKVLPLLKKFGFKATVSVVGKFTEKEDGETSRSNNYSYLNYEEIISMKNSGLIEFGNHTYDMHKVSGGRRGVKKRVGETEEQYKNAIIEDSEKCKNLIKEHCDIDLKIFTYPYGYLSKQTPVILKELGYRAALICEEGINKIERGNTDTLFWLKRYNRPAKFTTNHFFEKIVKI